MITTEQLQTLPTGSVISTDGDKIGSIGEIYLDDATGQPAWVTVNTGLFGTSTSFVPLDGGNLQGDDIVVPFTKDQVKDAPRVDVDQHLEVEQERELYAYYGRDYNAGYTTDAAYDRDRGADNGADAGAGVQYDRDNGADGGADAGAGFADTDRTIDRDADSVTLHEERLNVGTERVQTGTARLRKFVVGEQQTVTVPVERETVTVERRAVDGVTGGDIDDREQVIEVETTEERPVVSKETVATEEVGLRKDVIREDVQVTDTVRHEEVELENGQRRVEGEYDRNLGAADERTTMEKAKDAIDGDNNRDGKLLS